MIEDVAGYQPWPSFAAHSAAKAAQAMLTRVLAARSRPRCESAASPRGRCGRARPGGTARRGDPAGSRWLARGRRQRRRVPGSAQFVTGIDPGRRRGAAAQNRLASRDVEPSDGARARQSQLAARTGSSDHARGGSKRRDRRRADPPDGRRRPGRVRDALPPLRRVRSSAWRCAGSATAAGPRTRCRRRSRRSGARPAATGPSAGPARRGSTQSRGTRSSTAAASRNEPPTDPPEEASTEPAPTSRPRQAGAPGASTARSRSSRPTSEP